MVNKYSTVLVLGCVWALLSVFALSSGLTAYAEPSQSYRGPVIEMDAAYNLVVIQPADEEAVYIEVTDATQYQGVSGIAEIAVGDTATASGEFTTQGTYLADTVTVEKADSPPAEEPTPEPTPQPPPPTTEPTPEPTPDDSVVGGYWTISYCIDVPIYSSCDYLRVVFNADGSMTSLSDATVYGTWSAESGNITFTIYDLTFIGTFSAYNMKGTMETRPPLSGEFLGSHWEL